MTRCPRSPLLFILLGACAAQKPRDPVPPPAPSAPVAALPAGFEVRGEPEVRAPFLPPAATWRWLVSELRLLRAGGREVLVTFEADAFHTTDREGTRRTCRLPEGLRLAGAPVHALLKPDLSVALGPDSSLQVVGEEEVTVVTARIDMGGGNVEEFRLVAKGGVGFRSISTGGEAG